MHYGIHFTSKNFDFSSYYDEGRNEGTEEADTYETANSVSNLESSDINHFILEMQNIDVTGELSLGTVPVPRSHSPPRFLLSGISLYR